MKSPKGKLMIPIIVIVVLAGAFGGVYFLQPQLLPFAKPAVEAATVPTSVAQNEPSGLIYELKERILNLKAGEGFRYLKISIAIECESKEDLSKLSGEEYKKKTEKFASELSPKAPMLNDAITTVVTTKNPAELATAEGKEKLREELKTRFESIIREPKVIKVYFTEFVMQ